MSLNIKIVSIPHSAHRYPTAGDWYNSNGVDLIEVSQLPDERYELLLAVHELVEAALCKQAGISESTVDAWDTKFAGEGEPGDDPRCPYFRQHTRAETIERLLAAMLDVDWDSYEAELAKLP